MAEGEVVVPAALESSVAMSVCGSACGAVMAKKSAMAAQRPQMGTSSHLCQKSATACRTR